MKDADVKRAIASAEAALAEDSSVTEPEQEPDRFCDANCSWSEHHPDCIYGTEGHSNFCAQCEALGRELKELKAQSEQCQCPNCKVTLHASDCAVHGEPAYPAEVCDCGAQQEPEFFTHNVEQPYDWSEWVCPNPKGYLMKCCDCGLVHEAEFGVVRYKSETDREDCDMVDDPNLQAVFRMRRSEQWSSKDMAHRAGGMPMAQPEQEPTTGNILMDSYKAMQAKKLTAQPEQKPVGCVGPLPLQRIDMTIAWYDPTNHHVSTDKNDPLFTPLGQLWPLHTQRTEQEPCDMGVACIGCSPRNSNGSCPHEKPNGACECYVIGFNDGMKELEPPQRTWVGLTDDEALWLYDNCRTPRNLIEMVEAKLKEKNTSWKQ